VSARDEILARIGRATADVGGEEPVAWEAGGDPAAAYLRERPQTSAERRGLFLARLAEHGARAVAVANEEVAIAAALEESCARLGIGSAVAPADLCRAWLPAGLELTLDSPPLDLATLARAQCVVSAGALAIADTGTVVLDGGAGQGRRALSLVPDVHLCVVRASQLVGSVPEAIERLRPAVLGGRQLTLISGPSATSDIGFERVVGVHGPRTFELVLVDDSR
jgi:L-lactate dehydrogenase complex protein LldG